MPKAFWIIFSCGFTLFFTNFVYCDTLKIHKSLVQCYRGNNIEPWFANNLQVLLELIRKIEDAHPTSLDIRELSVTIIHQLRVDGIRKAFDGHETNVTTPYSPNGLMVPKFQLLLKLISKIPTTLNLETILTPSEICLLHRLVSSSVEPSIRGDETKTCIRTDPSDPANINRTATSFRDYWRPEQRVIIMGTGKTFFVSNKFTSCPIENGVIRTKNYGTLSPGTVIASIAAGLEPQTVSMEDLLQALRGNQDETRNQKYNSPDYEQLQYYNFKRADHQENRRNFHTIDGIDIDGIDNIFAANIAGDLAEVCFNQVAYMGNNLTVGLNGYWDDTIFPRRRYLTDNIQLFWAMTDSEILSGLDGVHIGNKILSWSRRVSKLRLSQVLEMYYSSRGIPSFAIENSNSNNNNNNNQNIQRLQTHYNYNYNNNNMYINNERESYLTKIKGEYDNAYGEFFEPERYVDTACERMYFLSKITKNYLKQQTYTIAKALQYMESSFVVNETFFRSSCYSAVDKFFERARSLIRELPNCKLISGNYKRPAVDLTLIIDGSRTKYENLKLISYVCELIDVSSYGSRISVIHGTTGRYMVNPTHSVIQAFEELRSFSDPFPVRLSLASSLETLVLTNQRKNRMKKTVADLTEVVLVFSQGKRLDQMDFENSKRLLEGSLQQFSTMYFLFVANDANTFEDLIKDVQYMPYNFKGKYTVISSSDSNPLSFSNKLLHVLLAIPKRLIIPKCDPLKTEIENLIENEYEDYLSPNSANFFKIDERELANLNRKSDEQNSIVNDNRQHQPAGVDIQFSEVGYGDITACKISNLDTKVMRCESTSVQNSIWFNITKTCEDSSLNSMETCPEIVFKIELDSSNLKCSESDCRFPDQVRFLIRLQSTDCKNDSKTFILSEVLLLLSVLFNVYYYCNVEML